jgi:hypothetical protein
MLDPAKELAIREALGTKIAAFTQTAFVRRPMIDSKQDWVDLLGQENVDEEYELKVCTVDLVSFVNSATDGCDDDPLITLTYSAHLFFEYKETRSDDSNSTDDFVALILNLNNDFLQGDRDVDGVEGAEYLPVSQSSSILLDEDPLTGAFGHFTDLLIKVQVL